MQKKEDIQPSSFATCAANPNERQSKTDSVFKWSTQNHASRTKKARIRNYLWLGLSLTNLDCGSNARIAISDVHGCVFLLGPPHVHSPVLIVSEYVLLCFLPVFQSCHRIQCCAKNNPSFPDSVQSPKIKKAGLFASCFLSLFGGHVYIYIYIMYLCICIIILWVLSHVKNWRRLKMGEGFQYPYWGLQNGDCPFGVL